jgi:putative aldouronate transport system permease protein
MLPSLKKQSTGYKIFYTIAVLALAAVSIAAFVPLILFIMVSISDEKSVLFNGYRFIPRTFSLFAYKMLFRESWVGSAYTVTIIVTVCGSLGCVLCSSMAGYMMSVRKVKYRNAIAMFFFIPMIFNAGIIPWYIWVTRYLHLKNTIQALIVPIMINPFWIFLLRNYFKTVPAALSESAEIDGAGPLYCFFKIIVPLSRPIIATIALFAALMYWNDYVQALWLIDKQNLYPLQYVLFKIQSLISYMAKHGGNIYNATVVLPSETAQLATFVITLGPIVLVYPFVQKYFVKGIMIGAVKG